MPRTRRSGAENPVENTAAPEHFHGHIYLHVVRWTEGVQQPQCALAELQLGLDPSTHSLALGRIHKQTECPLYPEINHTPVAVQNRLKTDLFDLRRSEVAYEGFNIYIILNTF